MPAGSGKKLGFIVNPIAGLGGRVGLKGSNGTAIQKRALQLGAIPQSLSRAAQALERLTPIAAALVLYTYPGEMGEKAARHCGLDPLVVGTIASGKTTAADTVRAARAMERLGVDLLLFAGGDGTARDIVDAIGQNVVVLGIPTGVKIQSAAFATSPIAAGELARSFLERKTRGIREAEVMDIDEAALRRGIVCAKLYGYLRIPFEARLVQGAKLASGETDATAMAEIARHIVNRMRDDTMYIVGPGTTTRAILSELGLKKTLIGVDVVHNGRLLAADANESRLLELLNEHDAKIVVTPIGGQGYLFGRGNQQISPQVINRLGRDNIIVVATPNKLDALRGQPFLADSGDERTDRMLTGYIRVVCGCGDYRMVRVSCIDKG